MKLQFFGGRGASSGKSQKKAKVEVKNEIENSEQDTLKFFDAFKSNNINERGGERNFVKIADIRETLGWSREKFDDKLKNLRDRGIITIHASGSVRQTEREIKNGFIDENGFRMGSITWNRGKEPYQDNFKEWHNL